MGKYSKKISLQRKVLIGVCAALGVVLALMIVILVRLNENKLFENGMSNTTGEASQMKELLVQTVTEQEDTVLVATTYGTIKYPYAFSDIMSVEAETFEDYAVLVFGAAIDGETVKLYTLIFNGEEGMPVGTLQDDGETYVITAQFHDVSGLSDSGMVTFYAAQETFNDVVNSLSENEGFTAAD